MSRACRPAPARKSTADRPPAARDATLIERLEAAGAVLVGALNMGEYAYDFTGENVHDGPSRNPHDSTRMTGGSSGGSGGAVGGGAGAARAGLRHQRLDPGAVLVLRHFRVEADLRPAVARAGVSVRREPRSSRSVRAHRSPTWRSPMTRCRGPIRRMRPARRARAEPVTPLLSEGIGRLRIAIAGGYFQSNVFAEAMEAVARVAGALGASRDVEIPEAARARAAAYVITATEGAALHLDRLRARPDDFDPAVRDRLIAGAMLPAPLVDRAQKFRRWYRDAGAGAVRRWSMRSSRRRRPASRRCSGRQTFVLDGVELPVRANIGIYTQPISFIGLPVVGRAGAARADADRRADHRGALARGYRAAHRRRPGAHRRGRRRRRREVYKDMEVDLPDVLAEVTAAVRALREGAGVRTMSPCSMNCSATIRARCATASARISTAIARSRRSARHVRRSGLMRRTARTVITTYGRDTAVASTLFYRDTAPGKVGRQMQTWVRFPEGWRIVAAHVSIIDESRVDKS